MRITLDARVIVDEETGLGYYTYNLLRALLTIDQDNHYTVLIRPSLRSDHPVRALKATNLNWIAVDVPHARPQQQLIMPLVLSRHTTDIYHYPHFDCPILQPHPCVVTIHDLKYVKHPEFFAEWNWLKATYLRHIIPISAGRAMIVLTESQSTKADLIEIFAIPENKIKVIPAAHHEKYRPLPVEDVRRTLEKYSLDDHPYVLCVSEIRPHKNLVRLIQAFKQAKQWAVMPHRLVIVGKKYSNYVAPWETIEEEALANEVILTGYVPSEDLPALYNGADVCVLPSLYEGFGIPILEAMACGVPTIVSNISSMPEVAGDASILIDPYDVKAIAEAIYSMLINPTLRHDYIKRGLKRAQQFSWQQTAEQTLGVYEEVYWCVRYHGRIR